MKLSLLTLSGLTAAFLLTGCATEPTTSAPAKAAATAAPAKPVPATSASALAPAPRKVTITTAVFFNTRRSTLDNTAKTELDELAARLKNIKLEVIIATGHSDNIGATRTKERRSLRRAQAVKTYLLSKGVAANRIYVDSKGDTQPAATNKLADGRARNRRVDIEVIGFK